MTGLWAVFAALLLLDAFRVRARISAVQEIAPSPDPVSDDHVFLLAPHVILDESARRGASAYARAHGIQLLDLIPADLPATAAWGHFQFLDPVRYRADRIGKGRTAGHAVLVTTALLEKAGTSPNAPSDPALFVRLIGQLKHYASTTSDIAIAPGLRAIPQGHGKRRAVLREVLQGGVMAVLVTIPLLLIAFAYAAITNRVTGFLPLVAFHLQPLVGLAGGRLHPRGLAVTTLLRSPLELGAWLSLVVEGGPPVDAAADHERRLAYTTLLKDGTEKFFEPRIQACPLCDHADLQSHLSTRDLLQHKPGRFRLDRCAGCGHVFQNPRLSLAGLDFYYRDFYDGLGADEVERLFSNQEAVYTTRARLIARGGDDSSPRRWLDVGGGHGHFCQVAKGVWPNARFDALDLSLGVEEAARRGWVEVGYRGLFPDLAPALVGKYDVVSMSHYLEHTRDPKSEISAASRVLVEGGLLLIEVPDPTFALARLLGPLWLPWFQPQHQHFVSCENAARLLGEAGFDVVLTQRGEAHQEIDGLGAAFLLLDWIAPTVDLPWRKPTTVTARLLRPTVFVLGIPILIAGRLLDAVLGRILRNAKRSNTYRVLARKRYATISR